MKKHFFLLFAIIALLFSCGEDDDTAIEENEPVQLIIKKYTPTSLSSGNPLTYFFDQDGNFTKRTSLTSYYGTLEQEYFYNELGNVIEKRALKTNGEFRTFDYFYDAENKIESIDYYPSAEENPYTYIFFHSPDTIRIATPYPGVSRKIYFEERGKIQKTTSTIDLGGDSDYYISYDTNNNIVSIDGYSGDTNMYNYLYEYENFENPLFHQFHDKYFNLVDLDGRHLHNERLFFSPHLVNKITFDSVYDPDQNFIITINYHYNEDGYPISSESRRDNILIETAVFEYY